MAIFCKDCNQKLGFFDEVRYVEGKPLCINCHIKYNMVLEKVGDDAQFKEAIEKYESSFANKDDSKEIISHLKDLHIANLRELSPENNSGDNWPNQTEDTTPHSKKTKTANENIGPYEEGEIVYSIDGVRGRHIDVYKDKVVIATRVTLGSILTHNATDGEKTIYYVDCIGIQFKPSRFAIGYLQIETAAGSDNNAKTNFWNENSFTYDESVISNDKMLEVVNYVKSRVDAIKKSIANFFAKENFSVADELLKLSRLLDDGILTQEEFAKQKEKLLCK